MQRPDIQNTCTSKIMNRPIKDEIVRLSPSENGTKDMTMAPTNTLDQLSFETMTWDIFTPKVKKYKQISFHTFHTCLFRTWPIHWVNRGAGSLETKGESSAEAVGFKSAESWFQVELRVATPALPVDSTQTHTPPAAQIGVELSFYAVGSELGSTG